MATLKMIRKRIISVRNTQKITKAMKMVAAAKLRRAQMRLVSARPYVNKMEELLNHMARLVEGTPHPVFAKKESVKKVEFLVLTSDRGLCGGFNGNLLRRMETFLREKSKEGMDVRVTVVGKKGRDFLRSRKREPENVVTGVAEDYPFEEAYKTAEDLIAGYAEGRFDEFYLVYNYFRSAITQEIHIDKVLPFEVKPEKVDQKTGLQDAASYVPEYVYEPSRQAVLDKLVPHVLANIIRRAFLDSTAGEFGARMMAMENATNNSSDMIFDLTLQMNRVRQAAITKELMDIVNGAESLK